LFRSNSADHQEESKPEEQQATQDEEKPEEAEV